LDVRLPSAFDGSAEVERLLNERALKTLQYDTYLAAIVTCREEGAGTSLTRRSAAGALQIAEDTAG
jgi:hypothetical protein